MSSGTVTIRVTDDGLSNGDRKVTISGSAPYHPGGFNYWYANSDAVPVVTSATLTVQDDEPPAATLVLGETSINESGTGNSTTVEARLSRAATTATTITLAAPAGTSLSGTTLTIDAGDTSSADAATAAHRQVTLTAVDNTTDAPDRMVTVTGTSSLTGESLPLTALLTIADDDDAPMVTLSLSNPSISENGGTSAVSATLSHPSSEATTVTVQAASGLYTVGTDATITIAAGETANSSDTVSITAVNDITDEPDRSVTVTGMAQNSQGAGAVSGAALTITDDDDTPTVRLAVADPTIEESSSTASETMTTVTATLSNPSSEATTITVTAVSGAYAVGADATITIAAGETANSSDTASITAVDNDIDVGASRAVTVTGTAQNSHEVVGEVSGAALTITDDDEAGLTVSKDSVTTTEAAGAGRTDTFTVHLASEPTAAVTVTISVTGDDTDEATVNPQTLKFAAAANSGNNEFKWDDPQTVTVTGVDENVEDSDRPYTITVAAASGDAIYNDNTKVPDKTLSGLNVDDDAPRVTLILSSTSLNESGTGNSTTIEARLSQATATATTITLTAPAGTRLSGTRLTIDAGETSSADADTTAHRQVTLTAVDNTTDAPDRMVSVTGSASNAAVVADPAPVSLTIADDDNAPTVTLSLSSASISENGGTATVSATLSNPSSEATTVTVQAASGLYTVGADATITIAAGETANSSDTASITAVNNAKDEPNRSGTVTASARNSQGVGMVTGAPLTITDDDAAPTVTLAVTDAAIKESSSTASETMTTVSATLSNPSSEATTVTVAAVSGAYAVGADATITIAAGETANSSDTASIRAVDDDIDVGASRIVTVTGAAQNSRGAVAVTGAALTITDDDEAGLTVSKNSVATTEAAGVGRTDTFTVQLDTEPTATVTVTIGVTGGDTDEATVNPQTLKFAAMANSGNNEFKWDDPRQVTVTGQDDGASDGERSYTITVAAASGDAIYNDNAKVPDETVSGTNADDDAPKVTLVLGGTSINESGTGNSTTVSARLSRASTAPTAITLTAPAGTTLSATRLTIDAGETSSADADTAAHRQVTLTAVDNDVDAADRMVSVTGSASNAVAVVDPAAVSLTIVDDDTAGLTVSKSSVWTSEPNVRDSFTVKLDTEPTATVTVTIGVTGGDTDEATVSPTTLKFAAEANSGNNEFKWDDPRQVTVTGQDDSASDGDRSYTITVAAASADANYNALSKTVSGLNADDDVPRVTLVLSQTEIAESGEFNGTTITAFLDRVSTAPTTITVTAPPGTTLSETRVGDTLLTLDTLTIDADEFSSSSADTVAHRQLTLRAVDNGLDAPDRVVTVTGTATSSAVVSGPAGVSLTITDDDTPARLEATPASNPLITYEGVGPPASIRVRLQSAPTAGVTLSIRSRPTSEVTVTPSTLKFAATADIRDLDDPVYDWNVRREVTVRGVDDLADDNDQFFVITMTAASADTRYHGQSLRVGGVNLDDDDPEVKLSLSDDSISENGGTTEVSAALTEVSYQTVTLTLSDVAGAYTVPSDANTITIEAGETKSTDRVTLTAVDNTTDSPDRSGTVRGISSPRAEVVGAELTLEDDDDAPTVTLAVADAAIKESSDTASETMTTVSATLSHASSEDTTITVTPAPGAYTVGSDATITIAAGETANSSDTASITAVNNTRDEPDRMVTVTGLAANSHEAGSVTGASLTITDDDDPPTVTLTVANPTIKENSHTASETTTTVSATLSHASSAATTITVTAVVGAYTVGSDATITIAADQTSNTTDTATITAVDNDVDAADNDVTVTGTAANAQATAESATMTVTGASLTITDDDEAGIAVSPAPSTTTRLRTTEDGGTAAFTVTLASEPTGDVVLGVGTTSTTEGMVSPSSLTFTDLTWNTEQTVTLTGVDDDANDGNQNYTVTLTVNMESTADTNYDSLSGITVYAVNVDNEYGLDVSAVTGQATESGGTATFTVALLTQPLQAVTVTVTSRDADGNSDASEGTVSPSSLTFTTMTWDTSQAVTVTGADDAIDDGEVTWAVRLDPSSGDTNYNGVSNVDVSVTTTDDDAAPGVTLTASPSSIAENGGESTVTAKLSHPSGAATTVTVTAVSGFYRVGSDATIVIAAGSTANATDTATIEAVDNDTDAPDRAGTLTATITNDRATADGTTMAVTDGPLTVTDDEMLPKVTLALSESSISETGGVTTVTAKLSHPSSEAVRVTVDAAAGTRAVAADFTLSSTATLTIAAGDTTSSGAVTVTANGNDVDSLNKSVTVSGTVSGGNGVGAPSSVTLTLEDDDTAGFVLSPTTTMTSRLRTTEDGGTNTFTVKLASEPTGDVVLGVASSDTGEGTVSPSSLTFTARTWNTAQTVTLTGVDDSPADADGDQPYTVTLTVNTVSTADPTYGALGPPPAAAITVYAVNADNEYGLAVSSVTGQATEAGGTATFTVALNTRPSAAVTVTVTSRDASGNPDASEGRALPSSLTFTTMTWDTNQTVTVTGADDAIDDGDVTWAVRLDPSSGDLNYDNLADVDVSVTTEDNDDAPTVTLALSPTSIDEMGGVATVTATLSRASGAATTVTITEVSGFYRVGADASIAIAAGATATATDVATIVAVNNATDEPDRAGTVTATVTNARATADGTTLAVSGGALTVTDDDDAPNATLTLSDASIAENGGVSTVSATLSHPSSAATTVTVTPVTGAYTVGADATIVIGAGLTATATDVATIAAVDNATDEPNRTATVTGTLTNNQGAGTVTGATLTLEDNDDAPAVTLALSTTTVTEAGGQATVSATLSHPSSAATTVTVTAGTTTYTVGAGADATIVLAAGQTTSTDVATITAVDNAVDAAANDVTVTGTAANSHAAANSETVTVTGVALTITDDDVAGIETSPATTSTARLRTTESGDVATFTVTLASEPTGAVVLAVASTNTAEGTVSAASLTFTARTWHTAQTVTLTGVDDSPAAADGNQDYTVTLTVNTVSTADTIYNGLSAITVYAVNADNEYGLDVGTVMGPATEAGGTATFPVALLTQPASAVTVSVTSQDTSEGTVSPSSLTFTPMTWNTNQPVTVTGEDDAIDDGDVTWAVRLDPSSGDLNYDNLADVDVSMTTTDDDAAPTVTLALSPTSIAEMGGMATVTATLSRASGAVTTVTVTPVSTFYTAGTDAVILIPAGQTANASDTATVVAVDDAVHQGAVGRTTTVTATVSNSLGTGSVTGAALTLTDNEAAPGATLALSAVLIPENGGTAMVSATLARASAAATTVTVTAVSGFYTVGADATILIAAGATTAASDTVTITAVDNATDEPNRTATVTGTLANSRGAGTVTGVMLTLEDDDDAPTVALALSTTTVTEAGGQATVSATLSHPSSAVTTVTVTAGTTTYTVGAGADATIVLAAGQTTSTDVATITAVDNAVDAVDNDVTVTGTAANSHAAANSETVTVTGAALTITDDDDAGIATSPATTTTARLRTTESGDTATFTVTLASEPTGDVVLGVVSSDTAEGTALPAALTFTATTWNTAQPVTLTGVDDAPAAADGNQPYTVTLTVNQGSTADPIYGALGPPPAAAVTVYAVNADNEYGLDLPVTSGLTTTEAGGTATFPVALLTQPAAAVTVTVTSQNPREGRVAPPVLVFTMATWNTAQSVVVTGVDDDVDDGDQTYTVMLDPSSGDPNYDGLDSEPVEVTTTDDDAQPTVMLAVTPATITEAGGVSTVTATLSGKSSQAVTLTVATPTMPPALANAFTQTGMTLTIPAEQTTSTGLVTVTAVDNAVDAADKTVTVSATATPGNTVTDPAPVTLTITDDDTPGLEINKTELALKEEPTDPAHMRTYTVKLKTEPTAAVTVTVTNPDPGAVTVVPTTLPFTTTNWNTAQPVTVTAVVEPAGDYRDETVSITHTAAGDSKYRNLPAPERPSVSVTVADQDTPPTLGADPDLTMATYNGVAVTLKRAPDAPPAVAGVEVTPPATTNGDVPGLQAIEIEVELEPEPPAVAADGSVQGPALFSVGPPGARTVVEITVRPPGSTTALTAAQLAALLPEEGITICLPVNAALRAAAAEVGERLQFLHYTNGAWRVEPPVEGPPEKVCARLTTFSPMMVVFENLKPAFQAEVKPKTYYTGRAVTDELPGATGGNPPLRYKLLTPPALPAGLTYTPPAAGARHGGTIRGTPTTPEAAREYTLTATDKNRDEATLSFSIEVKPGIQSRDLGLVLAGVGRTLASDAVEILGGRFGSAPASRLQITLGGQVLRLTNPQSPSPSPLAGEGQGEGGGLRGEGKLLQGEGSLLQGEATRAVPVGSSPWQQATGLALSVARALGVTINTPSPHSPSPLAGEGRGEGGILQSEGGFLQNETNLPGRLPTDLRRGTTTSSLLRLQPVSGRDLLARSAFELPLTRTGEAGVPAWTLWGRGSAAGFSGQPEEGFKMDGTLYSGYLGLDYRPQATVLLGLAVAHSTGDVSYEREATKAGADVELTSVLPYAHWQPRPGLGVWGLAGVGWGEMDLKLVGDPQTYTTGLTSWLGAVGGRQALTTWQGIDLAAKTDAFLTTVRSAGKTNLPAARGHAQRVRLVVEGRTAVDLSPVSRLEPRLELGGRWDNGTAEQGLGSELGGGVAYTRTDWGLSVDAQGRYLLLHEDGAFEDWGASMSVRLDPGVAGEGAYLTVAPVWGQASSGVEQLWGTAAVLPQARGTSRPATGWQPGSLEVDVGYGVALADGRGLVTPYGGLALSGPGSSRYRLGSRLALSSSLDVTLEGERAEQPGQKTAYGVSVRLGWQW